LQNPLAPPRHAVFGLSTFKTENPVARKPKTAVENKSADDAAAQSGNGNVSAPEPKKKSRPAATPAKKKKPAASKKSPAKDATAKPAASTRAEPTDDEIRLRAYFLAERRHRLSLPGDSNHDWIEARRQLIEEAGKQS
jgi:hypothetical protein